MEALYKKIVAQTIKIEFNSPPLVDLTVPIVVAPPVVVTPKKSLFKLFINLSPNKLKESKNLPPINTELMEKKLDSQLAILLEKMQSQTKIKGNIYSI